MDKVALVQVGVRGAATIPGWVCTWRLVSAAYSTLCIPHMFTLAGRPGAVPAEAGWVRGGSRHQPRTVYRHCTAAAPGGEGGVLGRRTYWLPAMPCCGKSSCSSGGHGTGEGAEDRGPFGGGGGGRNPLGGAAFPWRGRHLPDPRCSMAVLSSPSPPPIADCLCEQRD